MRSIPTIRNVLNAILFFTVVFLFSLPSWGQDRSVVSFDRGTGRVVIQMPPNGLGEGAFLPKGDDAEQRKIFNRIIDEITVPYVQLVAESELYMTHLLMPGRLFRVELLIDDKSKAWENGNVNANASQEPIEKTGQAIWRIQMFGGLFRRPEITEDGFALVLCHELGHHLAGFPFHIESLLGTAIGLAAEGEADYFATHSCLKRHFKDQDNSPPYGGPNGTLINTANIPKRIISECESNWNSREDRALCHRIAIAGFSVATLWGAMDRDFGKCNSPYFPQPCFPKFDSPDRSVSPETQLFHPLAQCRLDTYFAGSLCSVEFMANPSRITIPGKFEHIPENSKRARIESEKRSCPILNGNISAAKPLCWYNPDWPFPN